MIATIAKSNVRTTAEFTNRDWFVRAWSAFWKSSHIPPVVMFRTVTATHLARYAAHFAVSVFYRLSVILAGMLLGCRKDKILNSIVGFYSILVVNVLPCFKMPPKERFHNKSMLQHPAVFFGSPVGRSHNLHVAPCIYKFRGCKARMQFWVEFCKAAPARQASGDWLMAEIRYWLITIHAFMLVVPSSHWGLLDTTSAERAIAK